MTSDAFVYRHGLFQSARLCSLYDVARDQVLEPLCSAPSGRVKSVAAVQEDRIYYEDPIQLFDFFELDEDARFALLSGEPDPRQRAFLACMERRRRTWRLAVKRKIARSELTLQRSHLDIDLTVLRRRIDETGANHVIIGVEYALFDVVILDSGRSNLNYDDAKRLLDKAFARLKKEKSEPGLASIFLRCLSPKSSEQTVNIEMSYYNNASHEFRSQLDLGLLRSLMDSFARQRARPDFFNTLPNTSLRFKLMHVNQFLQLYGSNYTSPLGSSGRFYGLDNSELARLVFELYSRRVEIERLASGPSPMPESERIFKATFADWTRLEQEAAKARFTVLKCVYEGKRAVAEYRRSGNVSTLSRAVQEYKQALQSLVYQTKQLENAASELAARCIDWTEKMRLFKNNGIVWLESRDQVAASATIKYVFVFEPSVGFDEMLGEWRNFLAVKANARAEGFFCPIGHFEREITGLAINRKHKRVLIHKFEGGEQVRAAPARVKASQYVDPSVKRTFSSGESERDSSQLVSKTRYAGRMILHDLEGTWSSMKIDESGEKTPKRVSDDESVQSPKKKTNAIQDKSAKTVVTNDRTNTQERIKKPEPVIKIDEAINILLLGETGVGKSTFINAYYNYLTFGSLDEAMVEPGLRGLVCSTFSFTDSEYNVKQITVPKSVVLAAATLIEDGVDCETNEAFVPGQSSTQHAKAYEFRHQGRLIRLIDTPGIGDSRGISTDQANFKQTIEYLARMDHLNAVCILLKPNVKRMELQTRYCIKELFSHLNKVSIKNIVFCFTNTRGTSFLPGDTLPSLQKFVTEEIEAVSGVKVPLGLDNIVCMDNEAFRYLVLAKNVKSEEERKCFDELGQPNTFAESWRISKDASVKLVKYAQTLPVLKMSEMVAYNQSRSMSLELVDKVIAALCSLVRFGMNQNGREIVQRSALLTSFLSSKAVTIFNDQFDARLEERIRACKMSIDTSDGLLGSFLAEIRDQYKQDLIAFSNNFGAYDIDAETARLYTLVNSVLSQA